MLNRRFGRLVVLTQGTTYVYPKGNRKIRWKCRCDCGNELEVYTSSLNSGKTQSCGCLWNESRGKGKITHGNTGNYMWSTYEAMLGRCYGNSEYAENYYGSRGIIVCDRWLEPNGQGFHNFLQDMREKPKDSSLDRIDPNGNYEAGNCRWVSKSMSAFNTRKHANNSSGRTGVKWSKRRNKWISAITVKGEYIHLGCFISFDDAVKVREDAEILYFGELKSEARNI